MQKARVATSPLRRGHPLRACRFESAGDDGTEEFLGRSKNVPTEMVFEQRTGVSHPMLEPAELFGALAPRLAADEFDTGKVTRPADSQTTISFPAGAVHWIGGLFRRRLAAF